MAQEKEIGKLQAHIDKKDAKEATLVKENTHLKD